jgi:hypothetical protein
MMALGAVEKTGCVAMLHLGGMLTNDNSPASNGRLLVDRVPILVNSGVTGTYRLSSYQR